MKSVTFKCWDVNVASARLRAIIPQRELSALGVPIGRDVLVIGKHDWDWDAETRDSKRVIFDVCDDHFADELAPHYIDACSRADAVTCNSRAMALRIAEITGRDAWVIPDPWEAPESEPRIGDHLLWYGFSANIRDLMPWLDLLAGYRLTIVSNIQPGRGPANVERVTWSFRAMDEAFAKAGLVVLPTGNRLCKSGNRAIEAIRRGLFPVCGPLPAYADLGVYVGRIDDGVDWALSHREEAIKRVRVAQDYVRDEYAPSRIGKLWQEVLNYV